MLRPQLPLPVCRLDPVSVPVRGACCVDALRHLRIQPQVSVPVRGACCVTYPHGEWPAAWVAVPVRGACCVDSATALDLLIGTRDPFPSPRGVRAASRACGPGDHHRDEVSVPERGAGCVHTHTHVSVPVRGAGYINSTTALDLLIGTFPSP